MKISQLYKYYELSIKNVPLLKYSRIVIAAIFIMAIAGYFRLNNSDVFIYAFALLLVCVLGYIFSLVLKPKNRIDKIVLYMLVIPVVITTAAIVVSFGCYIFFQKPKFYAKWFEERKETVSDSLSQMQSKTVNIIDTPFHTKKNALGQQNNFSKKKFEIPNKRSISIQLSEKSNGYAEVFLDGNRIYPIEESTKFNPRIELENYKGRGLILIITRNGDSCWTTLPKKFDSTVYRIIPNCL